MILVVEVKCEKLQKKITRLRKSRVNISELVRKSIADYERVAKKL